MDLTASRLQMGLPIQFSAGSQSAPQIYFSTDSTSGLYRPATNNIGITTNGTLRFNVTTSAINFSLPITLPTTGGTATNFDYYERTTQTMILRHSNFATVNWTITLVRIGTHIEYHFPDDATLFTMAGANRTIDSETNTIPSRFRPSSNQVFSYIYLTGGLVWTLGKVHINSNGTIQISPLNGNFLVGDQLYIERHSNSFCI